MSNDFDDKVYEVSSIIKLLTTLDVKKACKVANNLKKHYNDYDSIDKLDNVMIYNCYTVIR